MLKTMMICALVLPVAATSMVLSASPTALSREDCIKLHNSVRSHVETIYLMQMAEFRATRSNRVERDAILSRKVAIVLEEFVEALAHYDNTKTRRGLDVVLKLCPL